MPKVSIVVPIYNVEKYLRQCLDSVVNQTLKDIEIICVNDGSTDNSLQILKEYAENNNNIKIINKSNSGYGNSMNIGIDIATGDYIGIVEPDDYIDACMFEILYNKAIETGVDIVKSDFYQFSEDMVQNVVLLDSEKTHYNRIIVPVKEKSVFHLVMNTWTGLYKRSFINKYNIRHNETPGARYQDQGFWFQTIMNAKSVYFLNKPFYHYRYFSSNSTNNPNGFDWIQTEYKFIYDKLQTNQELWNALKYEYNYFKFFNYLFNYRKLSQKQMRQNLRFLRDTFKEIYDRHEIDMSLFSSYDQYMYKLLISNENKYYRMVNGKDTFMQKLFSIKNKDNHKIVRILGLKIKIKREIKQCQQSV